MPHSWKAFDIAKRIVEQLLEGRLIKPEDTLTVRGIIQIVLEEGKRNKEGCQPPSLKNSSPSPYQGEGD